MQIADIEKNENPIARPLQLSEGPSHGSDFATPRGKQPDLIDLTTPPRTEEEKSTNPKVPTPVPERLRFPGETSAEAEARLLMASRTAVPIPPWPDADRTNGGQALQPDSARHQLKEMRDQMEMITRALKTETVANSPIAPPPGPPGTKVGLIKSDGQGPPEDSPSSSDSSSTTSRVEEPANAGSPRPYHPLIPGDWVNLRGMSQREINIKCVKLLDGNLTKKELRQMNDEEINLRLAQAIDKINRDAPGAPSEGANRASQRTNRSPEIDRDLS